MSSKKMLSALVFVGLIFFSGYLIWHALYLEHEADLSVHWPTVTGQVLSHRVSEHWQRHNGTTYEPIVRYEYEVAGEKFTETRISWFTHRYDWRESAERFLTQFYPIGAKVPVHYDPNHPHHACLIPGGGAAGKTHIYAALTMAVVGGGVLVVRLLFMS